MAFLPVLFFRDLEYTLSIAVGTALGGLWFSGPLDSREVRARKIRHGGGDRWMNHRSRGSLGFTCWRTLPDADLMSFCRALEGMQTPEQAASPSTTSLVRLQEHEAERLQPVRFHSWMSWFATGCCRWFTSHPSWEHSPWASVLRFSHFTPNAKKILRNSQNY